VNTRIRLSIFLFA